MRLLLGWSSVHKSSFPTLPVGSIQSVQFSSVAQSCLTLCIGSIRSPQIPILSAQIVDHPEEGEQKPVPLSASQSLLTNMLQGTILQDKSPLSRHRKVREIWGNSGYSFFVVGLFCPCKELMRMINVQGSQDVKCFSLV